MGNATFRTVSFFLLLVFIGGCGAADPGDFTEQTGQATYYWWLDPNANWDYDSNGHKHYYYALVSGQRLMAGDYVTGDQGLQLKLQSDCNLVFSKSGKALWASHTERALWCHATMQSDGNLVVYDDGPVRPVWASNTVGHPGSHTLFFTPDKLCLLYGQTVGLLTWCAD